MDTFRGFKVFRDDSEWTSKMLVASVLLLSGMVVPIVGQAVLVGWSALLIRGQVNGRPAAWSPPLRFDFDYLGKLFGPGFRSWIARLVWSLPIGLVFGFVFGCLYVGMFVAAAGAAGAARDGGGAGAGIAAFIPCLMPIMMLILVPLAIVASIPATVAALRVELTDDLKQGMNFRAVMDMTKLIFREALKGTLLLTLVSIPLVLLGELCCFVGIFPAIYVIMVANCHFQAQLYGAYLAKGGAPLTIAADEIPVVPIPTAAYPG